MSHASAPLAIEGDHRRIERRETRPIAHVAARTGSREPAHRGGKTDGGPG